MKWSAIYKSLRNPGLNVHKIFKILNEKDTYLFKCITRMGGSLRISNFLMASRFSLQDGQFHPEIFSPFRYNVMHSCHAIQMTNIILIDYVTTWILLDSNDLVMLISEWLRNCSNPNEICSITASPTTNCTIWSKRLKPRPACPEVCMLVTRATVLSNCNVNQ